MIFGPSMFSNSSTLVSPKVLHETRLEGLTSSKIFSTYFCVPLILYSEKGFGGKSLNKYLDFEGAVELITVGCHSTGSHAP